MFSWPAGSHCDLSNVMVNLFVESVPVARLLREAQGNNQPCWRFPYPSCSADSTLEIPSAWPPPTNGQAKIRLTLFRTAWWAPEQLRPPPKKESSKVKGIACTKIEPQNSIGIWGGASSVSYRALPVFVNACWEGQSALSWPVSRIPKAPQAFCNQNLFHTYKGDRPWGVRGLWSKGQKSQLPTPNQPLTAPGRRRLGPMMRPCAGGFVGGTTAGTAQAS